MNRIILGGNCGNSSEIAEAIAKKLKLPFYRVIKHPFRDTEILVRLPIDKINPVAKIETEELKGIDVIYVQSTAPSQSEHLIELFMTVEGIKHRGAKSLTVIVPYLAHARQDKAFNRGEAISKAMIGKVMKSLGVDKLITVDVHFHREVGEYEYEGIKSYNATAAKALAEYVRDKIGITSPKIVIPDIGHKPIIKFITPILGNDVELGEKKRTGETNVSIVFPTEDLRGKPAVVFDDMISGGITSIKTAQNLKARHASKVIFVVTHTLYVNGEGEVRQKLMDAGIDQVIATDTIKREDSVVSIAPVIVEAIQKSGF